MLNYVSLIQRAFFSEWRQRRRRRKYLRGKKFSWNYFLLNNFNFFRFLFSKRNIIFSLPNQIPGNRRYSSKNYLRSGVGGKLKQCLAKKAMKEKKKEKKSNLRSGSCNFFIFTAYMTAVLFLYGLYRCWKPKVESVL